jgi:hypothetical protein
MMGPIQIRWRTIVVTAWLVAALFGHSAAQQTDYRIGPSAFQIGRSSTAISAIRLRGASPTGRRLLR